jgi:hypothetical protein
MSEMVISTERPNGARRAPLSELRMTIQRTAASALSDLQR